MRKDQKRWREGGRKKIKDVEGRGCARTREEHPKGEEKHHVEWPILLLLFFCL
jgi:hypothetical protein